MPTERTSSPDGLFRSLSDAAPGVGIEFDGVPFTVPAGISVAAALLVSGQLRVRGTTISGAPRAPYCMMGACFDCLVQIDGIPSRQSCMVQVRDGMQIRSQEGARVLGAAADTHLEQAAHDA
jgi:hypothetical protein